MKMRDGLNLIEDRAAGSEARLRELYLAAFNETEAGLLAAETKARNKKTLRLLLLVVAVAILGSAVSAYDMHGQELDLKRPGAGMNTKTIEAEVSVEYGEYIARDRTSLHIQPREPSEEEAAALLLSLGQRLPVLILGKNDSLSAVIYDLNLPDSDKETGAEFSWRSNDGHIISNDGRINLVGVAPGTSVTLTAFIRLASVMETFHIAVQTGAGVPEDRLSAALKARAAEAAAMASGLRDGEAASLPAETADGVKFTWTVPERNDGVAIIFACVLLAFFCYTQRYRGAARTIEKARAEIERDFPDFIQKLGLLLGAGLVITSAISRITDDYIKTRELYGRRRLYEELAAAQERMRASGTPLVYEFAGLARRSGLRELMRFSTTLADNIDKGSALADKLRAESELLWESRKKRAEKEGHIAETKLIFPMALQVLAVIAITVMPAAFEMG